MNAQTHSHQGPTQHKPLAEKIISIGSIVVGVSFVSVLTMSISSDINQIEAFLMHAIAAFKESYVIRSLFYFCAAVLGSLGVFLMLHGTREFASPTECLKEAHAKKLLDKKIENHIQQQVTLTPLHKEKSLAKCEALELKLSSFDDQGSYTGGCQTITLTSDHAKRILDSSARFVKSGQDPQFYPELVDSLIEARVFMSHLEPSVVKAHFRKYLIKEAKVSVWRSWLKKFN